MNKIISVFNLSLLLFSFLFVSCEKDEKPLEMKKGQMEKEPVFKELNITEKHEKDLLNQLGFEFKDEKIIIDINKTSNFFTQIEAQMKRKAEEIELKIAHADINISQDMGIKIEGDQVGIDLNRTRNMLQQINILMKDILLDVNAS